MTGKRHKIMASNWNQPCSEEMVCACSWERHTCHSALGHHSQVLSKGFQPNQTVPDKCWSQASHAKNFNFQMSTTAINRFNSLQATSKTGLLRVAGNYGTEKEFIPRTENVKNLPQGRWGHARSLTWVGTLGRHAYYKWLKPLFIVPGLGSRWIL